MDLSRLSFKALDLPDPGLQDNFFIQRYDDKKSTPVPGSRHGNSETRKDSKDVEKKRFRRKSRGGEEKLQTISLDEVAWHDTYDDCWVAIYDYVYNCTDFVKNHPGGQDILLEYAGRDATLAFIGTGHSQIAKEILERYRIGELPVEERLFRTPGGVKIVNC